MKTWMESKNREFSDAVRIVGFVISKLERLSLTIFQLELMSAAIDAFRGGHYRLASIKASQALGSEKFDEDYLARSQHNKCTLEGLRRDFDLAAAEPVRLSIDFNLVLA